MTRLRLFIISLLAFTLLIAPTQAQDVWTWHNNNNRTGWQDNESILSPTTLTTCNPHPCFGLLWQYKNPTLAGQIYAQPLAVQLPNCTVSPCNLVFVATEEDWLYAFDASSSTRVWATNLAAQVGGTAVNCAAFSPPCAQGVIYPNMGVTGTPVIDVSTGILYVVSLVQFGTPPSAYLTYYLHAIDIRNGQERGTPIVITASVTGQRPMIKCATQAGAGTVAFDPVMHIQRTGLLLLTSAHTDSIYVGFAPADGEFANGWLFGYTFDTQNMTWGVIPPYITTPYGTGGGIWESAAGLASDGTYIYVGTGNGTFDSLIPRDDYGESILKIRASDLTVYDHFTPADVFTFPGDGQHGLGRCLNDEDLGSGGIMLFPNPFYTGHDHLMVSGDKESKFFVIDRDDLTGYHSSGDLILEEIATPVPLADEQGYLSTPAYWEWSANGTTTRTIYYSAEVNRAQNVAPLPINMYQLNLPTAAPISVTPTAHTPTLFCGHGATPSISANGTTPNTGLLWAIEDSNSNNQPGQPFPNCNGNFGPATLHAYNATNNASNLSELCTSGLLTSVGPPTKFSVPTIFNGRVYIGTRTEVDVFGLCSSQLGGCVQ